MSNNHQYTSGDERHESNNEANVMMPVLVLVGVTVVFLLILLSGRTVVEAPEVAAVDSDTAAEVEDTAADDTVTEDITNTADSETAAEDDTLSDTSEEVVEQAVEGVATGGLYTAEDVATGQSAFVASCSGCHGSNALGVPGLGKNLVESEFVHGMSDVQLHEFIVVGRTAWDPANTTGVAMPPRGGNPALNDETINQIIAYIRTLADPELLIPSGGAAAAATDPTTVDSVPSDTTDAGTTADTATDTDAAAADAEAPIDATTDDSVTETEITGEGEATTEDITTEEVETTQAMVVPDTVHEFSAAEDYALSCAGCHGPGGEGVGEWPALVGSDALSDADALLDLITPHGFVEPSENFAHPTLLEWPVRTPEEQQAIVDYIMSLGE